MNATLRKTLAACALTLGLGTAGTAAAYELPAPNCPINCQIFGDFTVYSLALLNALNTNPPDFSPDGSDPWAVPASNGQIDDFMVIGSQGGGQPLVNNGTDVDNTYDTPAANTSSTFTTADSEPINGPSSGDGVNSWDASVSALRDYLNATNSQLVTYFRFDETGQNDLDGEDLLAWARATLVDLDDPSNNISFYLRTGSDDTQPDPTAAPGTAPFDPYVYVNSLICVNGTTFLHEGACTGSDPAGSQDFSSNLGDNLAAFAIYNATLDQLVRDPNSVYDILRVDWVMAFLNGGGEAAWIANNTTVGITTVPEPMSLTLLGISLLGMALALRLRRKH